MDLSEIVSLQRQFDQSRESSFGWSRQITSGDTSALIHNSLALAGEVGELANLVKKHDRGDFSFDELLSQMPGELADIFIYLIKIAYQSGIDLEAAFLEKLEQNEGRFPSAPGS